MAKQYNDVKLPEASDPLEQAMSNRMMFIREVAFPRSVDDKTVVRTRAYVHPGVCQECPWEAAFRDNKGNPIYVEKPEELTPQQIDALKGYLREHVEEKHKKSARRFLPEDDVPVGWVSHKLGQGKEISLRERLEERRKAEEQMKAQEAIIAAQRASLLDAYGKKIASLDDGGKE